MIEKIEDLMIYKELKKRDTATVILGNLVLLTNLCKEILAKVNNVFPNFTNHDIYHSFRVAEFMAQLLPKEIDNYNDTELTLMLYVALTHDLGMASFKLDSLTFEEIEDIRKTHHTRSKDMIIDESKFEKYLFEVNGFDVRQDVGNIDYSHNKSVKWIKEKICEYKSYGNDRVNLWFICYLLRIADYIDFDRQRAPYIIYDYLSEEFKKDIRNKVSDDEWLKQLSIRNYDHVRRFEKDGKLSIQITFEAETSSSDVSTLLFKYFDDVEKELNQILNNNIFVPNYYLPIEKKVNKSIIQNDSEIQPLKQYVDYLSLSNLLMGKNIYSDSRHALIELIQNAIDAVSLLSEIKGKSYRPIVEILVKDDKLIIHDNGIGMTKDQIEKYFLCLGKSYYSSPEYEYSYSPRGHFGIGFLSSFLLSDKVVVKTISHTLPKHQITMELCKDKDYVLFSEKDVDSYEEGTSVELELNKVLQSFSSQKDILKYLTDNILDTDIEFLSNLNGYVENLKFDQLDNVYTKYLTDIELECEVVKKSIFINRINDFLDDKHFFYCYSMNGNELIDDSQYSDCLIEDPKYLSKLLEEDDDIAIIEIAQLTDEQVELLNFTNQYNYEDDDTLMAFDGNFDNPEDWIDIYVNPNELQKEVYSYGHILFDSGDDFFYNLTESDLLRIAKDKMYLNGIYICKVFESKILINDKYYIVYDKGNQIEKQNNVYLKKLFIKDSKISIPFLFPAFQINSLKVNITNNCLVNISRENIDFKDKKDIEYAVGRAIHLNAIENKAIGKKTLNDEEIEMLKVFTEKYYSEKNKFCK